MEENLSMGHKSQTKELPIDKAGTIQAKKLKYYWIITQNIK